MTNPFEAAVKKSDAADKEKRKHWVTIYVRGCDTTRDCYCLNSNGFDHNEGESPWVVDMEGNFERGRGKEEPLEFPFRQGEDLEDYGIRMVRRETWDECFEWCSDMFAMPAKNHNPYE